MVSAESEEGAKLVGELPAIYVDGMSPAMHGQLDGSGEVAASASGQAARRLGLALLFVGAVAAAVTSGATSPAPRTTSNLKMFATTAEVTQQLTDVEVAEKLKELGDAAADGNWGSKTPDDLFAQYPNVFPHFNRNAASHRWATFVLDRASQMSAEKVRQFFAAFCPVSGSPISGNRPGWHYNGIKKLNGGTEAGQVRHCCAPCVCDTQVHLRVDKQTVATADGPVEFDFLVVGDPCADAGKRGQIPDEAPDVNCFPPPGGGADVLDCALSSDAASKPCRMSANGGVIVGMLLPDQPGTQQATEMLAPPADGSHPDSWCAHRAATGTQSGMGTIFIKVAEINPL